MATTKSLKYTGVAAATFYTDGKQWSVDPGEVIPGDRPDRKALLDSGWFEEVTPKKPAKSRASGTTGGASDSKGDS